MCGGTDIAAAGIGLAAGLSPRVRGNPDVITYAEIAQRSIPACAGEPGTATPNGATSRVYPRVCGGTTGSDPAPHRSWGLSPRVRGNRWVSAGRTQSGRSIPACAGEPILTIMDSNGRPVYPRVCGGTADGDRGVLFDAGLSPRVRGNHATNVDDVEGIGSIPACAGEPPFRDALLEACTVYPRVCGGTFYLLRGQLDAKGLSPRVRGNQGLDSGLVLSQGSIPACAGEPPAGTHPAASKPVYPRVCGGTAPTR